MKKITQYLLLTLTAGSTVCGGLAHPATAETIHDDEPYIGRPFVIDKIMFERNEIGVHYTGIGTGVKTNYLNVFWTDFSEITETEADILMAEAETDTPTGMINFFQKKVELSPNTAPTFLVYKYANQGTMSLWEVPGVLYYTVRLADGTFLKGKTDYRDCLSNPYFIEKKEAGYGGKLYCKLESFGDDRETYYWPYHTDFGRLGDVSEPIDSFDEEEPIEGGYEDVEEGPAIGSDEEELAGDDIEKDGGAKNEPVGDEELNILINNEQKEQNFVMPKTPNTGFGPRK